MSEEAKKLQTEEINAENPQAEEEFEVSEEELEDAAGGIRVLGEPGRPVKRTRAGRRVDRRL